MYEADGYRWLCSPADAIQSAMQLSDPGRPVLANQRAMTLAATLPRRVRTVLDLGTGVGALLRFARDLPERPAVVSVDSDRSMLELARRYFAVPPEQPLQLHDARDFIRADTGRYDLVFCDLFRGRDAPPWLASAELMASIAARLATGGAVGLNTLPASAEDLKNLLALARGYFAGVGLLQFAHLGNIVLILSPAPLPDRIHWAQRLIECAWSNALECPRWLEQLHVVPAARRV